MKVVRVGVEPYSVACQRTRREGRAGSGGKAGEEVGGCLGNSTVTRDETVANMMQIWRDVRNRKTYCR